MSKPLTVLLYTVGSIILVPELPQSLYIFPQQNFPYTQMF